MKHYLKIIAACLLVSCAVGCVWYSPSIESATLEDLDSVPGIGPELASDIIRYCLVWEDVSVDELDCIDGIGPIRLKALKERYR